MLMTVGLLHSSWVRTNEAKTFSRIFKSNVGCGVYPKYFGKQQIKEDKLTQGIKSPESLPNHLELTQTTLFHVVVFL